MQGVHPVAFFFLAQAGDLSHSILKSHLHLAPYLNGSLLPQFQAVTAARAKHALDGRAVSFQQRGRHKGLDRPRKTAALHPPGSAARFEDALAQRQRDAQPLMPRVGGAVDVLTALKRGMAICPDEMQKLRKVPALQGILLGQRRAFS